jgi:hypothetical protein
MPLLDHRDAPHDAIADDLAAVTAEEVRRHAQPRLHRDCFPSRPRQPHHLESRPQRAARQADADLPAGAKLAGNLLRDVQRLRSPGAISSKTVTMKSPISCRFAFSQSLHGPEQSGCRGAWRQRPRRQPRRRRRRKPVHRLQHAARTRRAARQPAPRCGARNRAGQPCRAPAMRSKKRCQMHDGESTGPRTADGSLVRNAPHGFTATTRPKQSPNGRRRDALWRRSRN